jgi:hypothetical protein
MPKLTKLKVTNDFYSYYLDSKFIGSVSIDPNESAETKGVYRSPVSSILGDVNMRCPTLERAEKYLLSLLKQKFKVEIEAELIEKRPVLSGEI